jgi:hypothetical protein
MTDADRRDVAVPEDDRPWERPGAVRRDVGPHRGDVLLLLARVALVLAACSFCCAPVVLVALPLTVVAYTLAYRDLKRMEAGAMDPAGQAQADQALLLSWWAFALGTVGVLPCTVLAVVLGPMAGL